MTTRTRFAPSPTGYLHVGSARTALFCWLYTKKTGGKFVLRIEDTDRERSTEEAIHAILDAMEWMGLDYDEGPFYQMKRLERYHEIANQLIKQGSAYRCTCSKERLEKLREEQLLNKEKPRYDGFCREKNIPETSSEPFVVRFKTPQTGTVEFTDCIHGHVVIQNKELDDVILIRSDHVPTYNFGVVVDDIDMKITHVIRGDDHLANTPRQIHIFKALNADNPIYAHLPMILGHDGKRLSKRHGAVSVQYYRDEGILPQALLNYLVRLGWSHGDQEIFSIDEMINLFDLKDINKAAAAFNNEKLLWLNQHYIKSGDPVPALSMFKNQLEKLNLDLTQGPPIKDVFQAQQERAKTLKEMAEKSDFFYKDDITFDEEAKAKNITPDSLSYLKELVQHLEAIPESDWRKEKIHDAIMLATERLNIKLGKLAQPLRVALTGNVISPPIDITLELIGKKRTLQRLSRLLS